MKLLSILSILLLFTAAFIESKTSKGKCHKHSSDLTKCAKLTKHCKVLNNKCVGINFTGTGEDTTSEYSEDNAGPTGQPATGSSGTSKRRLRRL